MGLVPSINNFIQHFKHPDIALITFSSNITDRFEKDHELALYRIALELINNGIKHGKPKNIKLTIDSNGNKDRIILTYTDNGKGFDYASAQKTVEGSGMYNIQNRVSSLKGSMQINTAAGKGVKVIIDIPLAFG